MLVGGLVAMNFIFPLILGFDYHPNWRTHIFQRGAKKPPTSDVAVGLDLPESIQKVTPLWTGGILDLAYYNIYMNYPQYVS